MSDERYPIEWRCETYYAREMTDDLKHKYCLWLYRHTLKNAQNWMNAKDYLAFERRLTVNPPEWTSVAHPDVIESFNTTAGCLRLFRLAIDVSEEAMSDEELNEMVTEKEKDPTSDFNIAMKLIRENADPKAKRGGHGSPAPEDVNGHTPLSATNPSDSNGQKSAA